MKHFLLGLATGTIITTACAVTFYVGKVAKYEQKIIDANEKIKKLEQTVELTIAQTKTLGDMVIFFKKLSDK